MDARKGTAAVTACTLWFDHFLWWNWAQCCVQHDWDYANLVPKILADAKLGVCVNRVLPFMGDFMESFVVAFGGLWYLRAIIRYFGRKLDA